MSEKILITSALPYANGPLHFGHIAGAYLPGDCYARFQRLMKKDVLYICGSDEYGVAITLSADLAGRTPKEQVDLFHAINRDFFKKLNFSFDHYSRTTWKGHSAPVHQYFLDLLANGYIEERITNQLYSEKDQRFLADRYVEGECPKCGFSAARGDECQECGASYDAIDLKKPRSKLTKAPLILKPTKHWFLLLEKFKDQLVTWLETKKWKSNVTNFIKGYIQDLHARAITRDSTWGVTVPVPNSEGKVLYVWFDAPIGYISATQEWAELKGSPESWKDYWYDPSTKLVNFIGKDNIPFHASIFPAMTMGQNQPYKLVDELPANEFYKLEGKQFSKSEGWYIDLEDFFTKYTTDQIRYTIAANAPETSDSEFTWKDFQLRCNVDLLGKYGNLVNRVLVFTHNKCQNKIPERHLLADIDQEFLQTIKQLTDQAAANYESFKLRAASQTIMELAQAGNVYFDKKKPWADAKSPETQPNMETTLSLCFECLKILALISFPIIPEAASKVWKMIGFTSNLQDVSWRETATIQALSTQSLPPSEILFTKIEDDQIKEEILKLSEMSKKQQAKVNEKEREWTPLKPLIDIEEVRKLDLRVGVILSAVSLPKSKKMLQLQVDLGFEQRSILSGISQFYKSEELVGKRVIVVANLKPAILMGLESQGMVLAGSLDASVELVTIQGLPAGSIVS